MSRDLPLLAAVLIAASAAAWSAAEAQAPAKKAAPAAKAPAPKAPASKAGEPAFDARDPASLIALLGDMKATAEVAKRETSSVKLNVSTGAFSFGVQYVDCNEQGKACQAVAFTTASDRRATLAQINSFNQTSLTCRVFMDNGGKSHVVYSTVLTPRDNRDELRMHVGVWQGCLATFGEFLRDPAGYLAAAP